MSLIMVPYFRLTNNCSKLDRRYRFDTKPNFPPEDEEKCEIPGWKKKNNSFHDMKIYSYVCPEARTRFRTRAVLHSNGEGTQIFRFAKMR